jgi:hypothetical protein
MSTRKSARKRSFDHESRNEAMQRRLAGFEGLIMRAAHGDPEPLCAYLRDGDPPIPEEDARLLAWLLERKLPRRRGRPRGSLSCKNVAVQCASYLVGIGKRRWCERHGRKIATKNTPVDRLIKRAIELVEPHFPSLRGKINEDEVRAFKLKPSQEVVELVAEDFPEAKREIALEALNKPR